MVGQWIVIESRTQIYSAKKVNVPVGKEGDVMERTAKALYDKINGRKRTIHRFTFPFLKNKIMAMHCI
jgi:hypothetical protein